MTPVYSCADLGRLVREARKAADFNTERAAGLCGVSVPFLNHLENGKPTAEIDKVLQVCRELGVRVFAEIAKIES